jgi:nitrous oxide reductase accessory protein NosL
MEKITLYSVFLVGLMSLAGTVFGQADIIQYPTCPLCGMDRKEYAHSRMIVEYAEGPARGTCSLHCTASEMTFNRDKTMKSLQVADYNTKNLLPAGEAFWVIGGDKTGVMTKRAKWAFHNKERAEAFIWENGGQPADFQQAIKATFVDMYEDIKMIRGRRQKRQMELYDLTSFPECKYCGMNRKKFAHSRAFIEYNSGPGSAVGTCSVHCLAIDMALNMEKTPKTIMIGDYHSKKLIDAEKAFWVMGGDKAGVMSIRGKWAFEEKAEAERFIRANGGSLSAFEKVMEATFEDMYEILR